MDIHARLDGIAGSITDLRERMGKAEVRIEAMDKHMATKADVKSAELSMIKWIAGAGVTVIGSLLAAMAKGFGWL